VQQALAGALLRDWTLQTLDRVGDIHNCGTGRGFTNIGRGFTNILTKLRRKFLDKLLSYLIVSAHVVGTIKDEEKEANP